MGRGMGVWPKQIWGDAMKSIRLYPFLAIVSLLVSARVAQAQAAALGEKEIAELIDRLADVAEGDLGYSASMSGDKFLPLEASGHAGAMLLGQKPPKTSDALKRLVEAGASAIPALIAHLNDLRETKINLSHEGGFGGMMFNDEYDFNARVTPQAPEGLNQQFNFSEKHPICASLRWGRL
jgi:hypothetical protein